MNVLQKLAKNEHFLEAYEIITNYPLSDDDFYDDDIDMQFITNVALLYEEDELLDWEVLETTNNVKDFFRALLHCEEQMQKYEKVMLGGIHLPNIVSNEIYLMMKLDKAFVIDEFLTRSFDYAYRQAQKFKTADGRINFMRRYFEELKAHSEQMCSDNIFRLEALEMMIEANGVEPSARKTKQRKK